MSLIGVYACSCFVCFLNRVYGLCISAYAYLIYKLLWCRGRNLPSYITLPWRYTWFHGGWLKSPEIVCVICNVSVVETDIISDYNVFSVDNISISLTCTFAKQKHNMCDEIQFYLEKYPYVLRDYLFSVVTFRWNLSLFTCYTYQKTQFRYESVAPIFNHITFF